MIKHVFLGLLQHLRKISVNPNWQKFHLEPYSALCQLRFQPADNYDFNSSNAYISTSWKLQIEEDFKQQLGQKSPNIDIFSSLKKIKP